MNKINEVKELVQATIGKLVANNRITSDDIKKLLYKGVNNNNIKIEIKDFVKLLATIELPGNIKLQVKVSDKVTKESVSIVCDMIIENLRAYAINKYMKRVDKLIKEKKYRKAYKLLSKVKKLRKSSLKQTVIIDEFWQVFS